MEEGQAPLKPASISSPVTSSTFAVFNYSNLPSLDYVLQSRRDLPIAIFYGAFMTTPKASYRWINNATEAYIAPQSLAFRYDGQHFVAGAKERLAVFNVHQDGCEPLRSWRTTEGRRARKVIGMPYVSLKGLIFSLAISNDGALAAATTDGQIGIWADYGEGESVTSFQVEDEPGSRCSISKVAWSSDGRYLFAAKRQSDILYIYDIRGTGQRLGWLEGRSAQTTLPLGFEAMDNVENSVDIWAGGTDGVVRVWRNVTQREGAIAPDSSYQAHQSEHQYHPPLLIEEKLIGRYSCSV